jgi:hypothetical protein
MVTGTASFEYDRAALLLLEERDQFLSAQLPLQLRLASGVNTMDLEDELCSVHADQGNSHGGRLPLLVQTTRTLVHRCRWGPSTPSENHSPAPPAVEGHTIRWLNA